MCEQTQLDWCWSILFWPSHIREAVTIPLHSSQAEPQTECCVQSRCHNWRKPLSTKTTKDQTQGGKGSPNLVLCKMNFQNLWPSDQERKDHGLQICGFVWGRTRQILCNSGGKGDDLEGLIGWQVPAQSKESPCKMSVPNRESVAF